MPRCGRWGTLVGVMGALGLVVMVAWAQTAAPPKAKLERLKIAVAPLGCDTNFSWLQTVSGQLDKRPALEFLVGIDRNTGAYIPELAEKWEMAPDGKTWTITLRKGVKFHENWGEFTARDVRHAVFLITQPEAVASDTTFWRTVMGVTKTDTVEDVAKKAEQGVEIVDDYKVVFHLKQVVPEFVEIISAITDLPMESKARWDAGGKELYGQKVVGTGPFEFVERKVGSHVLVQARGKPLAQDPGVQRTGVPLGPRGCDPPGLSDGGRGAHLRCRSRLAERCHRQGHEDEHQQIAGHAAPVAVWGDCTLPPRTSWTQRSLCEARGTAGHEHGGQSAGHCGQPPGREGATASGHGLPPAAEHGHLAGDLESGLGQALRGASSATTRPRPRRSWRRPDIRRALSSPCISTRCRGSRRSVDIGQAMALDFQAIGLKPKLVEMEFPRVRELYRTKTIHGGLFPTRHAARALESSAQRP